MEVHHLAGTIWAEGLKLLHCANRSVKPCCSYSHLPMLLLMARSFCSMISFTDVSGTVAEHEPQDKGQEGQLND